MTCLRAETPGCPERTTLPFWIQPLRLWWLSSRAAWGMAALSVVTVTILFTIWRFGVSQGVVQPGKPGAARAGDSTRVNSNRGEPVEPAELRLALRRSFEDFELALRLNDQLLSVRDPMVVPSQSRAAELR